MHRARLKAGFLLFECIIVLGCISLMVVFSLGVFGFFDGFAVRSEIERIAASIILCQKRALITGRPTTVRFDEKSNSFSYEGKTYPLASGVSFGTIKDVKGPPANPTAAVKDPITFSNHQLTVTPDGTISSGSLYIKDAKNRFCYAVTCGVSQISYLRKYRFDKKWILLP